MTVRGAALLAPALLLTAWPASVAGTAAGTAVATGAGLHAERVSAATAARLLPGGPDAIGGIDDWALGNGTLCAVISDPSHESDLSVRGGVLVDVAHCGRDDDQFLILQPLLNLSRDSTLAGEEIHAEVDEATARIVARGESAGLRFETVHEVDLAEPARVRVVTRVERIGKGPRVFALGDVTLHVDGAMASFGASTQRPWLSAGFARPAVQVGSPLSMARAIETGDLHVLVGAEGVGPGIAYGVRVAAARREGKGKVASLPVLSLASGTFSAFAVLARPFWMGGGDSVGLVALAQTTFMDLGAGERLVLERDVWVGERADAASVTDRVFSGARRVTGSVDDPAARIHAMRKEGGVATEARPEADGRFAFALLPGEYVLEVAAPGGRSARREIAVSGADEDIGSLSVGPAARVRLPRGAPMRLVFLGVDGTPDPRFGDDLLGFQVGGEAVASSTLGRDVHLAGVPEDPESVVVPPGSYRVLATRGPEWGVGEARLRALAGETALLAIEAPTREVETPGWISADLHVHAAPSDDSAMPLPLRLASFVAEGCEVLVATDHDNVTDYAPWIARLGLAGRIASLVGVEVTGNVPTPEAPFTIGHSNVFPLPLRPWLYRGGAPDNEGRRLREVIAAVRHLPGEPLVQLNHPRPLSAARHEQDFFSHLSVTGEAFDPRRPLDAEPNRVLLERDPASGVRDLDFDAMELLNGPSLGRYGLLREDWFALLRQGERRTATANSDTHRAAELAALPRNYVALADDRAEVFDAAPFLGALRRGRSFGTTGPLLDVRLGGAGPGESIRGREAMLEVAVRAASWVPVARWRVLVDGVVVHEGPAAAGARLTLPLAFTRDAFVTVEVEGEPGETYAALAPGFVPFAFTNPVFVDADGDGAWKPPGL